MLRGAIHGPLLRVGVKKRLKLGALSIAICLAIDIRMQMNFSSLSFLAGCERLQRIFKWKCKPDSEEINFTSPTVYVCVSK